MNGYDFIRDEAVLPDGRHVSAVEARLLSRAELRRLSDAQVRAAAGRDVELRCERCATPYTAHVTTREAVEVECPRCATPARVAAAAPAVEALPRPGEFRLERSFTGSGDAVAWRVTLQPAGVLLAAGPSEGVAWSRASAELWRLYLAAAKEAGSFGEPTRSTAPFCRAQGAERAACERRGSCARAHACND